jgi:hypothetical protein
MAHRTSPMSARLCRHPVELVLALCFLVSGATLLLSILRWEQSALFSYRAVRAVVRIYGLLNLTSGLCLLLRAPRFTVKLQLLTAFLSSLVVLGLIAYSVYILPCTKDTWTERLSWSWPGLVAPLALAALHYGMGRWLKSQEAASD